MGYRRVFVIRKDLNLKPGKLAAMVGHCAEAYWTNLLKQNYKFHKDNHNPILEPTDGSILSFMVGIDPLIWKEYVNGIFTKTICEAKNLNQMKTKVEPVIAELGLVEGVDYGYINDKCLTDLVPENPDGTTTVGMWFRPMDDEKAHMISRKFKLYGAFDK